MKTTKLFIMAIGLTTFTMTACKPNAGEQTETAAPKAATEITEDSVIVLTQPDTSLDVSLMQALADRKSDREFAERQGDTEMIETIDAAIQQLK